MAENKPIEPIIILRKCLNNKHVWTIEVSGDKLDTDIMIEDLEAIDKEMELKFGKQKLK